MTRATEAATHNHTAIYAHNKVKPGLDGELRAGVAQHLKAKEALLLLLAGIVAIEARYEAVERVEHRKQLFSREAGPI